MECDGLSGEGVDGFREVKRRWCMWERETKGAKRKGEGKMQRRGAGGG